jgi:hypothetical protein
MTVIFYGIKVYNIVIVVAKSLKKACKLLGIKQEECVEYPNPIRYTTAQSYAYRVVKENDVVIYGE